jgi:formylglycine-generating enzyme required for sulfatase activity
MRKKNFIPLVAMLLFFSASLFAQSTGSNTASHGKAAERPGVKGAKAVDPKTAAIVKEIEARMLKIQGGIFTMGCVNMQDPACFYWEKPRHTVMLNTFYMSKFDVTQKEWKAIMGTSPAPKNCPECPVINVTWYDAMGFIEKLNQLSSKIYRLPTEAEWEYAAKGGDKAHGYKFSGGDSAMMVAWYDTIISHEAHPVGQKKPNELGLYDMSGDVWQWCSDWFEEKYYSHSPSNNPTGPNTATPFKCVRGGSWWGPVKDCRVANRDKFEPDKKDDDVGFRLVRN